MYTCKEIAAYLGILSSNLVSIKGFHQDSRLIEPSDLFFALSGERVDGHAFLREVAKKGAVAAVVSKRYKGPSYGLSLLAVEDVMNALHLLAQVVFSKRQTRIIAVTGSVGKTTIKEFIAALLSAQFRVAKTPGNANSRIGVPLALLNADRKADIFVVEMGMSQKGQIAKLVSIAPPEIAVITNIGLAHSAYFPEGLEAIAQAKAEVLSSSKTRLAILGSNVGNFSAIKNSLLPKKNYGLSQGLDLYLQVCEEKFCLIEKSGRSSFFSLPFQAEHLWENFCGAALVVREFGVCWKKIIEQTKQLKTISHRFTIVEKKGIIFVDDSYNASVSSMRAAFKSLPKSKGKTIAVIGDMKELGEFTETCHLEVAKYALEVTDILLCLGKDCSLMVELFIKNKRKAYLYHDFQDLYKAVYALASHGDVVLIKGANSHQLWRILD
ncbi:UDP-N-acetylmuramoyl-tripeptide--D-alanyl-D- alanine ligase [Candidatus Rhabdochlamydia oedothoracis]|uniref:UDP-N-acetylmuramoyl-tripeptide--D-alanyl-D-alanine ligase n=1 Tax=Candidatus Rhabdochlamydia oedothoracis TaxID=2720720 RepID=A0ABX8V7E4_9BACT|nr:MULTISPECIES: UDP-N-acetylmuramoyl-tripeptide--D-alanyl-D-alanine ligase [Rhabdochlamydia]KAG6558886.1 UDP-N-acetylmuramoyl-tripeptide--D-alanyl-D-alanine ligase [Candidatus Rhabdochlamydia sp. W815]MCL6756271.1 UDP-N-acetylmuramoyl-tripeptide--D-alanyl-D-alanine ligase [Candidatus Rhabdochlamydia oedothoracis]QYF49134.1 UDP-N-acetylmuramoyl-tripeptide--D-alanyl-D- alanine ligase [Candidatus Rhabdochlamydia oedothoracis]